MSDSTSLVVTTPEAFAELPDVASLGHVKTVQIGARLYRSMPRDQLFVWIARFSALRSIHLADDWIADDLMATIAAEFAASFPGVEFGWTFDGLAGGKHGR